MFGLHPLEGLGLLFRRNLLDLRLISLLRPHQGILNLLLFVLHDCHLQRLCLHPVPRLRLLPSPSLTLQVLFGHLLPSPCLILDYPPPLRLGPQRPRNLFLVLPLGPDLEPRLLGLVRKKVSSSLCLI